MTTRPALCLVENDRLLLMRYRYGGQDVHNLPGGNPDPGETLAETLVRELREELQITVRIGDWLLAGEVFRPGKSGTLHIVFAGELVSGTPVLNPVETSALAVEWVPLAEVPGLSTYPHVGTELVAVLRGQRLPRYLGRIAQPWFG
jgi:ADP-ribose pyrophosphatase YjhB (NUDIX family)